MASSTPTSSGNSTPSYCSTNSGLEDIQYLLYLDTLKRFREDDANIRRQIEEKIRQYQEAKSEYLLWYSKYVKLIELCTTRNALENYQQLNEDQMESVKCNINIIMEKTKQDSIIDCISSEALNLLKQTLASAKSYDNLKHLQEEASDNKAGVRAINAAADIVEATVESSIVQGLDYFLAELQMENFENF